MTAGMAAARGEVIAAAFLIALLLAVVALLRVDWEMIHGDGFRPILENQQ